MTISKRPRGLEFLDGEGPSRDALFAFDWSSSPLGPPEAWPQSLKATLGILFGSRHPMFLWWGPELIQFYNDAYLPSFGSGRHPQAMGQPGRECWKEIWSIIGPQIDDVMSRAQASWNEDQLVPILRNGRLEEVYWTYGYSPVLDEQGAVGGTLVVCTETTTRVLAERRLRLLAALAEATSRETDRTAVTIAAVEVLRDATSDLPFIAIFERDAHATELVLTRAANLQSDTARASVDAALRAWQARQSRELVPELVSLELAEVDSSGPWPEPPSQALITPVLGPSGNLPSAVIVFGISPRLGFDTSYQKFLVQVAEHLRLEQARVEALRVLERAHGEREKLLTELESANRAKDEFLAMLGHELRNPLSPIVTALELMKLKPGRDTSDERKIIERQVRHLVRLVDDLLDVAKITRGKVELRQESVEVADVLDKAIEIASHLFEQRRHRLTIAVPKQGLLWTGDPVRLAQAVANLLTNAARYTNPGGHVQLSAASDGDELVIRVLDDGVGISADVLPHVFDLFVQGKRSSDRAEGGLGIGLALVKNLVSLHGGFVTAYSAGSGRGSEFVIHLPLLEPGRQSEPPRGMNLSQLASVRRRVLVVDDNQDSAELLRTMLRIAGHDVTIAHDPLTALALSERFAPEIAVLDIGLPVMDGYELAARLRLLPETARCKLVAVTGYGQSEDRSRSERAGFATHLVKPIDVERLIQILQEPLDS